MNEIVILIPPLSGEGPLKICHPRQPLEFLFPLYWASSLRACDLNVCFLDADLYGMKPSQIAWILRELNPQLLLVYVHEKHYMNQVVEFLDLLCERDISARVAVGGKLASIGARKVLETSRNIDCVILGEGEKSVVNYALSVFNGGKDENIPGTARKLNEGIKIHPIPLQEELDALPWPARDVLNVVIARGGGATVHPSRGCYMNCIFCDENLFYSGGLLNAKPRWRGRAPERFVDEVEFLVDSYGIRSFHFEAENFFGPGEIGRKHVYGIAQELIRRQVSVEFSAYCRTDDIELDLFKLLKEAGLKQVLIGIEASSDDTLKLFRKGTTTAINRKAIEILESLGIYYSIGFIMFHPASSFEEIENNFALVCEYSTKNCAHPLNFTSLGNYLTSVEGACDWNKQYDSSFYENLDESPKHCLQHNMMIEKLRRTWLAIMSIWIRPILYSLRELSGVIPERPILSTQQLAKTTTLFQRLQALCFSYFHDMLTMFQSNQRTTQLLTSLLARMHSELSELVADINSLQQSQPRPYLFYKFQKGCVQYAIDIPSSRVFMLPLSDTKKQESGTEYMASDLEKHLTQPQPYLIDLSDITC